MKRFVLVMVCLALVGSIFAMGCERGPYDRYRTMQHRRVVQADVIGIQNDMDAFWLCDTPTRLMPWIGR